MRYKIVATGGTFDHFHRGHLALLRRSFEVGEQVVIGVTSDAFARKEGKLPDENYLQRTRALRGVIAKEFPGRKYRIVKLSDFFGPGIASPLVEAIVVSRETAKRVSIANALRAEKGYQPLKVEIVDLVLAKDFRPISSTRIRRGEIDPRGTPLKRKGGKQREG